MTDNPSWHSREYDLIIIGGGINGVAIARDAALRGLTVLLLEKSDFGSGASSKTSKLAHGGLRYLEQFNFSLVYEALHERERLIQNAPHLVKPLPFIFPLYATDSRSALKIRLGIWMYNQLSGGKKYEKKSYLSKEEVLQFVPQIKAEGLKGAGYYYDAQMQDSRLVIENMLSAEKSGAILHNHMEVTGLIKESGKVRGIKFKDLEQGTEGKIRAQVVVHTTGAWSNKILFEDDRRPRFTVQPSKGIHIVVSDIGLKHALILSDPQHSIRVFFVIPWFGKTLIGTTDTEYTGDPDTVHVDQADVDCLLKAFNTYFPGHPLSSGNIISTFAGLRPLYQHGRKQASAASREHEIYTSDSGLITLLGGKFTTYRKIAEEVVNQVVKQWTGKKKFKRSMTAILPLYGGHPSLQDRPLHEWNSILLRYELNQLQIQHLVRGYGSACFSVLDTLAETPQGNQPLCHLHPHLVGELIYSAKVEKTKHLKDWFYRRTTIAWSECGGRQCAEKSARILGFYLTWTPRRVAEEISDYLTSLEKG